MDNFRKAIEGSTKLMVACFFVFFGCPGFAAGLGRRRFGC